MYTGDSLEVMLTLARLKQRLVLHDFETTEASFAQMEAATMYDLQRLENLLPAHCMIKCIHSCVHTIAFRRAWYSSKYTNMLKFEVRNCILVRQAKSRSQTAANIVARKEAQTSQHALLDTYRENAKRRKLEKPDLPELISTMLEGDPALNQDHLTGMNPDTTNHIITHRSTKYKMSKGQYACLWGSFQQRPGGEQPQRSGAPLRPQEVYTKDNFWVHVNECWREYKLPSQPTPVQLRDGSTRHEVVISVYHFAKIGNRRTSCKAAEKKNTSRASVVETVTDITPLRIPGWFVPRYRTGRHWSSVGRVLFYVWASIRLPDWESPRIIEAARILLFPWARAGSGYVQEHKFYVVDCTGREVAYSRTTFLPLHLLQRQCLLFPCLTSPNIDKNLYFMQPLDELWAENVVRVFDDSSDEDS